MIFRNENAQLFSHKRDILGGIVMNAFFTALHNLFSSPAVAGIISTCDAGNHISSIVRTMKLKMEDNSIEAKILHALDKALEKTCDKLGWEYDTMVVHELENLVHTTPLSIEELSSLLMQYVGPSFTPEVVNTWIDCFDEIVATDQVLTNFFNTKILRSLNNDTQIHVVSDTIVDEKQFEDIMLFCPSNKLVFENLREAISNGRRIMPFVGAGISAFAYKTWKNMLWEFSDNLNPVNKEIVLSHIQNNNLLDAAQIICDSLGKTLFFTTLRRLYSEEKIDDDELKKNAAYYIPRICDGNCITTNYDRVLEHSFTLNSFPYDIAGVNDTLKLATYFRNQNSKGLIFKIHGDILSNNENILLSRQSYQTHYSKGSELRKQLERWIAGRTFLFIGTSLFNDEPLQVLTDMLEEGIFNYAIYPCSHNNMGALQKRFDDLGIIPIFYDEKDHSSLTIILQKLLD